MDSIFTPELFISKDYSLHTFTYKSHVQQLYSLHSSSTDYDLTGQIIWPAAELLSRYIFDNPSIFLGKKVIELGAGAGLSGLVASQFCDKICLTDGNDIVIELLEKNAKFYAKNNNSVKKLAWGKENTKDLMKEIGEIDVIIGADVLFWPDSIAVLVESLTEFKKNKTDVKIFIAICNRAKNSEDLFDVLLEEAGMKREVIIKEDNVYLYEIDYFKEKT